MQKKILGALCIALLLTFLLAGCGGKSGSDTPPAKNESSNEADFFKGKTVTIVVPHGAGGGYDTYARMIAPYLQKNLGCTVVVNNVTGAGGLIGRNQVYTAGPDGLTVGFSTLPGMLFAQMAGSDGVKYDVGKFTWLPRVGYEAHVLAVNPKKGLGALEDFQKAKEVKLGFSGVGSDDYYTSLILSKFLKLNIVPVPGYSGSNEANLAAVRGEVDGIQTTISTLMPLINSKDLKPVVQFSDKPESAIKDVPLAVEEVKRLKVDEAVPVIQALTNTFLLDRVFYAPPGVPAGRAKALQEAFDKSLKDPEFLAAAAKSKRPISYASGEDVAKMVKQIAEQSNALTALIKEVAKK